MFDYQKQKLSHSALTEQTEDSCIMLYIVFELHEMKSALMQYVRVKGLTFKRYAGKGEWVCCLTDV